MKIGIDARFYGPIGGGGLGRYTKEIVDHLELMDKENDYVIFLRKENWNDFHPQNSRFKKILAPYQWYGWKEQILMPWRIKKEKVDLMHFSHFNVPFFYRKKFIVTVHDLILLKYPSKKATTLSPLYFKLKYFAYKFIIRHALKKANSIITPSQFVKNDIIHYFKIAEDKIIVIYEGLTDINKKNSFGENEYIKNVDKTADKRLEMEYNKGIRRKNENSFEKEGNITLKNRKDALSALENNKYILYVGNAYPHKNLERLIAAFSLVLKEKRFGNLRLVLVGVKNYFYEELISHVNNFYSDILNNIVFWGYATDQELKELYKNAELYIFPSLQEGFGLPPLEAISFGVPVVCSNNSSLPEILGDAANYFDGEDEKDMAEKIKSTMENENLRKSLIEKGFAKVKNYSWQKAAIETLNVYEKREGKTI